jgi:hypothetical protein
MSNFFGGTGGDAETFAGRDPFSCCTSCLDWKTDVPNPKPTFDCSGGNGVEFAKLSFNFDVNEGEGDELPGDGVKGNVADFGGGVGRSLKRVVWRVAPL